MSYPAPDASAERARQWRVRNKVRTHGGRSLFAFVFSFLTVLAAGQTVYSVSTYTISQGWPAVPVLAVSLVLLIAPLAVLWFAWRTLQLSGEAGKSADVYRGRELGAQASDLSWQVISYAVAVLIICAGAWFMIVNDAAVSRTFFDVSLIVKSAGTVLKAFGTNIVIFFVSAILILVWALVIAVARTLPGKAGKPIRVLATLYSDLFRGLPAIITIYLIGFGLPLTGLPIVKDLSSNAYAIIALTLTYGAYTSEVYRAGIESVHPSQIAAARSLGLSYVRTMRYVVVPLAVRGIIPPLMNNCISLQKDTALVAIIGTIDAFNQSKIIAANYFNLSAVTTVAILFIVITIPQARFVDRLIERDRRKMRSSM
ncbi:amino acid ABC transporter permease [Ochrobactrum pecoris]|uniref:Amino acid ABC transporter permease n=1 Tax=Brucella pecoris TaxID=867683 RepID=A0A5C5CWC6_9HYPH|nr:amino acid ABC transporter permease [Brucella pecoris]MBB4091833.1 polar amino acid transport system permease protein [Brucella pecoris]NKW82335.1 amino acid ABC transporter permease [Brucella pecoris]TNV15700.1 amino acid ABC transporter permease [Brucella pecoris]